LSKAFRGPARLRSARNFSGTAGGIFKIRPNGSRLRDLTHNDGELAGSADPVWSPNGRKILFLSARREAETEDFTLGLTTMWPDGSHRHFISANPIEQHQPDWQSIS
jgi:Tol biopolymer transport system component